MSRTRLSTPRLARCHLIHRLLSSCGDLALLRAISSENLLYGLNDAERLERDFDGPNALFSSQLKAKGVMSGEEKLEQLCETACCWDFVKEFPLKLETRIGENGVKLSGGQTQCIAIARWRSPSTPTTRDGYFVVWVRPAKAYSGRATLNSRRARS